MHLHPFCQEAPDVCSVLLSIQRVFPNLPKTIHACGPEGGLKQSKTGRRKVCHFGNDWIGSPPLTVSDTGVDVGELGLGGAVSHHNVC